jgi:hypothetical protein
MSLSLTENGMSMGNKPLRQETPNETSKIKNEQLEQNVNQQTAKEQIGQEKNEKWAQVSKKISEIIPCRSLPTGDYKVDISTPIIKEMKQELNFDNKQVDLIISLVELQMNIGQMAKRTWYIAPEVLTPELEEKRRKEYKKWQKEIEEKENKLKVITQELREELKGEKEENFLNWFEEKIKSSKKNN